MVRKKASCRFRATDSLPTGAQSVESPLQLLKLLSGFAKFAFCRQTLVVGKILSGFRDQRILSSVDGVRPVSVSAPSTGSKNSTVVLGGGDGLATVINYVGRQASKSAEARAWVESGAGVR